ncbi:MAG: glycosyltransferase family 2 protein [Armatimonadota bacterium]|nr:glycosyltransferase family 2 protein [Armatimonadota bacterium]MDW8026619.1 glycosyltransferase family 2 protein [Armatimonadota bacterium]
MKISAVILTRNEAKNIERCLKSVSWADEMVVIDAESEDETREIAERMGARVIVHPWEGAGAQYAFGIAQAKGKWVLIVDADEEVTPELAKTIWQVINAPKTPYAGYKVKRVNYALGRWLRYGGWQEWVLRLFLRERVTSPPTLHPRFQVDGQVGKLPFPLRHYMASNLLEWWQRSFRLAQTEAEMEFLQGMHFSSWALLSAFWKFMRRFVFKGGFLDGWAGFYACLQRFLYAVIKEARLLELQRGVASMEKNPIKIPFK